MVKWQAQGANLGTLIWDPSSILSRCIKSVLYVFKFWMQSEYLWPRETYTYALIPLCFGTFHNYLLNTCFVPGTVLANRDRSEPSSYFLYFHREHSRKEMAVPYYSVYKQTLIQMELIAFFSFFSCLPFPTLISISSTSLLPFYLLPMGFYLLPMKVILNVRQDWYHLCFLDNVNFVGCEITKSWGPATFSIYFTFLFFW